MIHFNTFTLENGLQVVVHEDPNSLIAAINIMYHVGSRDEQPHKTGFAHLFEHLMFGGSRNIPSYDIALQQVGGSNNAFTTTDITSYHITLPAINLETAFWLESDRLLALSLSQKGLDIQKKVVIEEFKETHLNQPYGDAWPLIIDLAYQQHPYRWPVIGKNIQHIEKASLTDVTDFFNRFYVPNNAVLAVAGGINLKQVKALAQKWFGPIPAGKKVTKCFPVEAQQTLTREKVIQQPTLPLDAIYMAFHVPGRFHTMFQATEIFSTVLGTGKSSILYKTLVEEQKIFSNIGTYLMESVDPGLLLIIGQVDEKKTLAQALPALKTLLKNVQTQGITNHELEKAQNHIEASQAYETIDLANRAEMLAYATLLKHDPNWINTKLITLTNTSLAAVNQIAKEVLDEKNASILIYACKSNF